MKRIQQISSFLLKDYPSYFWSKPCVYRALMLPFLLIDMIIFGYRK